MKVFKDQILCFESFCPVSPYLKIEGHFKALLDFDTKILTKIFNAEEKYDVDEPTVFLYWMIANQYIIPLLSGKVCRLVIDFDKNGYALEPLSPSTNNCNISARDFPSVQDALRSAQNEFSYHREMMGKMMALRADISGKDRS